MNTDSNIETPQAAALASRHVQPRLPGQPSPGRRKQDPTSRGRIRAEPYRRQGWAGLTPAEILDRYKPGKADPLLVLDVLIELFNTQHTALQKSVSHKTQDERAKFLRRFFRCLKTKAGFKTVPDPRNLGQKHVHAMLQVWQREKLSPATIQTYLSFLRGLAQWLGKPGFIRKPASYGLSLDEYQRNEVARCDKSWIAAGIDTEAVLAEASAFDARAGASLRLMHVLGLRLKESITFRPWLDLVEFEKTGLPPEARTAEHYIWTKGKGGRARWVGVVTEEQKAAITAAQAIVTSRDGHMGNPEHSLKRNHRRMRYVLKKMGITMREKGATGHGLRHGVANDLYEDVAGVPSPVRGGKPPSPELDRKARLAVSAVTGHARPRAASAYIGSAKRPRDNAPSA